MSAGPTWLLPEVVLAIHEVVLRVHGGRGGVRLLESALGRPRNAQVYGSANAFELAASYAAGIVRDHPFVDGNKRTAFVAAVTFLELNGWRFRATEEDAVAWMVALAEKESSERRFAAWLEQNCSRARGPSRR